MYEAYDYTIQATEEEGCGPVQFAIGEDPTGKLKRIAKEWRLNTRPSFLRRDENGSRIITTPSSFKPGDFVEAVATLEIVYKDKRGKGANDLTTYLAIRELTRLYTADQLYVSIRFE